MGLPSKGSSDRGDLMSRGLEERGWAKPVAGGGEKLERSLGPDHKGHWLIYLNLRARSVRGVTGVCDLPNCMEVSECACIFSSGDYIFHPESQ